jgi:signal transduction histidine kinase
MHCSSTFSLEPLQASERLSIGLLQLNQQLLQEIQQHRQTESALSLQLERLNCLYHLVLDLNNAQSIEEIYQIAIRGIRQTLNTDYAAVIALDREGALRYQAALGISEQYQKAIEKYLEHSRQNFTEETVIIPNVQQHKGISELDLMRSDEGIQASAAFPLCYQGEHLGKIIVYYDEPHEFKLEEVQLAKTITTYVATAMTRKRGEAALQQSKEQLEAVLNAVPGLVSWISSDLCYQGVNQRLADSYGLTPELFSGKPVGFLNGHSDFAQFIQHFFEQAQSSLSQEVDLHSDHQVKTYLSIAQKYDRGKAAVFVQVDITDRKQVEEALRQSEESSRQLYGQLQAELSDRKHTEHKLQQANEKLEVTVVELARATRLKDEFLASMSHELRTPLNAILGLSEGLLEEVYSPLNPRQQKAIATIEKSGRHLLDLINDVLDLAKIESGKLTLEFSHLSVRSLCDSSVTFIKHLATQKSLQLSFQVSEAVSFIAADERRLRQLLINLLSNAVKFTPQGGQITLEVEPDSSEQVRFSVTDTGIGIEPQHLSKLFQSFVQIDSNLNRQYSGTGLGLALVRRIAELHGGEVSVQSQIGKGSCFSVLLPISPKQISPTDVTSSPVTQEGLASSLSMNVTAQSIHQSSIASTDPSTQPEQLEEAITQAVDSIETPAQTEFQRSPALILIAEDNEANVEMMTDYLTIDGYEIVTAVDGPSAIEMTKRHRPNLILMDIQMPTIDGLEAIQTIRADPMLSDIPIIALTALAMPGDRERCLQIGATEYMTKPVRLRNLGYMIQQLLQ